ncbi:MAG: ABC transporter substrate-binding protein [Clostridia bacterium]|nr:ABC transporter substrate-binding protein [Clostridia bacterium]MBR1686599.1 ABC transporter substrate-binding protein [Clostridia bacterium]MBR2288488.1 ABC transporter substrate-binding protein [Clostridia bacterium]
MKKFLAFALALALCLTSVAALAEVELTIAHIGPTTGPAALYGLATLHGAEIAVQEINEAGEFNITLVNEDDEHNVEKAVNAYNAALDAGAVAIIGNTTSKPCEAVSALAVEDRVIMITPSASSEAVLENGDDGYKGNVFQVCFTDPNQGLASAEYIVEHKLGEKAFVIYNNADVYSIGIRDTFNAKAAELGLEVVGEEVFNDETTDFTVQVSKAQELGADIVFLPMYYTPASLILQTAAAREYKPVFFGVDGMDGILGIEGFDTSLAEGVMLLTPFVATSEDPAVKSFVEKYEAAYGETPIQFAADAYDGVYALVAAAKEAGITTGMSVEEVCEALIPAMTTITVDGITGSMTWDETGAVTKTPMAAVIENGVYVIDAD